MAAIEKREVLTKVALKESQRWKKNILQILLWRQLIDSSRHAHGKEMRWLNICSKIFDCSIFSKSAYIPCSNPFPQLGLIGERMDRKSKGLIDR